MTSEFILCSTFWHCMYDYQTAITGALASIAAALSIIIVWRSANLPIAVQRAQQAEVNERKITYARFTLSEDLKLLSLRAKQAESTIKAFIASDKEVTENAKQKTKLLIPPILSDWEFMSLFSSEIIKELMTLRYEVENHNFDMQRASGAFGDDNFRLSILKRADSIRSQSGRLASIVFADESLSKKTNLTDYR